MDYSSANTAMWNAVIQLGIIAASILLANLLRRKVSLIQRTLIPTVVLAGFILLLLKSVGLLSISSSFFEYLTYHGIAIGFIAMSLRIPEQAMRGTGKMDGIKSGALIASTYVFQGILGLAVTLFLSYTFFPDLFRASGILLPMGYGQGPGQANNIGGTYESLGFVGGRSFALSLAAAGYLCACIIGVIYVNVLRKR